MSTRGAIARVKGDSWEGRYHHNDSYPTALGKTLWNLYHGEFAGDVKRMMSVLIDEHPAGWSTINADWSKPIGYHENYSRDHGPECYCHGDRHEEAQLETSENVDCLFCEWAYVISEDRKLMNVFCNTATPKLRPGQHGTRIEASSTRYLDGHIEHEPVHYYVHKLVGTFPLDGPEPDWALLEAQASGED